MGTHLESPCLSCGRDTSAGSSLFASRKRGLDRERNVEGFLCRACQPGSATSGGGEQSIPASGRYAVVDMPSI